jgi:uncharacterized membrane protein YdjX (TVP38/TMEM64 family)
MSALTHQLIEHSGDLGVAGIVAMFVLSSFILLPRPLLCALAGYLLGFWAIPLALAGSLLGSALAFLGARYLLRVPVSRVLARHPRVGVALRAVHMEGFRLIALLRLCSPIPGFLLNYFVGLTQVSLLTFMTASLVGLTPQIVLFVYLGVAGQMVTSMASSPTILQFVLNAAGLAALALGVVLIRRRSNRLLSEPVHPNLTRAIR